MRNLEKGRYGLQTSQLAEYAPRIRDDCSARCRTMHIVSSFPSMRVLASPYASVHADSYINKMDQYSYVNVDVD